MVEKKPNPIWLTVVISLLAAGGVNFTFDNVDFTSNDYYYCDYRPELTPQECPDGFSKYVDEYGKCLNSDSGNRICKTGWKLITDDTKHEETEADIPARQYDYTPSAGNSLCTKSGCVPI